jgi:hypothetical protein
MDHDRIHAVQPQKDPERWDSGIVDAIREEDGHCVVTVVPDEDGEPVDLAVTFAVRDLFVSRLSIEEGASPVGERIWYRQRGG